MAGMLSFEMEVNAALGELTDVSPAPRLETGAKKRPRNANGAVKTGKKCEEVKQLSVFGEKESDGCDKRTSDMKDIEDTAKDAVISAIIALYAAVFSSSVSMGSIWMTVSQLSSPEISISVLSIASWMVRISP